MAADPQAIQWRITSPREAALRILAPRFGVSNRLTPSIPLADFQRESVDRASAILQQRGGVLIADSVGLGKTFVALALIESALSRKQNVLLVVPACLRRMWRTELRKLNLWLDEYLRLVSHTQLASSRISSPSADPSPFPSSSRLVVVDEAHAFRNPRTRRYRALRRACFDAQVVLLTATPINNSLADLYFQLRLFCPDTALRDLGIGSLRATLKHDPRPNDLARIKRAVVVRSTRAEARAVRNSLQLGSPSPSPPPHTFRFPKQARTRAVYYELPLSVHQIADFLGRLEFPGYRLDGRSRFSPEILRYGLLKRMESSGHAMRATLSRQIRFYEELIPVVEKGMLLRPRTFHSLYDTDGVSLQLVLEVVALEQPSVANNDALITSSLAELATLREWHGALRCTVDDKLHKLIGLLRERPAGAKTVVFSEYRDTAAYLWRAVRDRFAVGLIEGSAAWIGDTRASRRHVLERFAPRANGVLPAHPREAISVLIATDVLAEGMNLQDSDAVVSYDLPWNPIRLIQRAGRVDRIGSEHEVVQIYNFIVDREFDAFLGLVRTLRNKLETVRTAVGLERAVLEPEDDFEAVARSIASDDPSVLDRLDGGIEAELRSEFEQPWPCDDGTVPAAALPDAGGSKLVVGLRCRSDWAVSLIDPETGAEFSGADEVLMRALSQKTCLEFDATHVMAAARRFLEYVEQRKRAAPLDKRSPPARLARVIRHHLSELPLDAPAEQFAEADTVLEQLGSIADILVEEELDVALHSVHSSFAELLRSVQNAFSQREKSVQLEAQWQLVGVIVAD
jgi:superfamily II DNA or RNA helicase